VEGEETAVVTKISKAAAGRKRGVACRIGGLPFPKKEKDRRLTRQEGGKDG